MEFDIPRHWEEVPMSRPNLRNLELQQCCTTKLRLIRDEFDSAGLLSNVLAIAPFAIAFGMNPTGSVVTAGTRAGSLVISVASGDWDALRAVTSRQTFAIARGNCRTYADTEWIMHNAGIGPLGQFWTAMRESF
jgi:hypothetical protein